MNLTNSENPLPTYNPINPLYTNSPINIINHTNAHLDDFISIPIEWINISKNLLHIAYWHTSHGSQLITGMQGLRAFMGNNGTYDFSGQESDNSLHLYEPSNSWEENHLSDNTDDFDDTTKQFIHNNQEYNVVIWSWCSLTTNNDSINEYLTSMNQLEIDYPSIKFVYMTGHLNGGGEEGDVYYYNQMIRNYCIANNKILYDFADIESYDPDNNYFRNLYALDNCTYDSDGDNIIEFSDANWALDWQSSHNGVDIYTNGGEWFDCGAAHSFPLNANMKGYGAWYLFAILAGWEGTN
ncbi:MAG: hypothetical protein JXA99_02665 [Candidatus Lokiarchaeota archaeon]|nr:hypothetical protein [Candidatus Lokiarchaeota archaeon]